MIENTLRWGCIDSPLGDLYLAVSNAGLAYLDFGCDQAAFLEGLDPRAEVIHDPAAVEPYAAQVRAYFAGERHDFDLPVDLSRLTDFQRAVLAAAGAIPPGEVRTYQQLAQAIDRPQAARAVGAALAHNPIPLVIPCHRVIGSDGGLHGYGGAGGLETKKRLLQMEGAL
ncbi:MAG: methylated-DNA--[protein]-cysteine S-methyltransferase [Anaerolineae bacterium]